MHRSGTETPAVDKNLHDVDYVPPPDDYRPGVFGAILSSKLADLQRGGVTHPKYQDDIFSHEDGRNGPRDSLPGHSRANSDTYDSSRASSGGATPSGRLTPSKRPKWYDKSANHSMTSMATLVASASAASAAPAVPGTSAHVPRPQRPHLPRSKSSSSMIATAVDMIKHPGNVSYLHPVLSKKGWTLCDKKCSYQTMPFLLQQSLFCRSI